MFPKFFNRKKATHAEEVPKLPQQVAASILNIVGRGIPTMPGAAQRAFQLSTDPNAEARDFIEVIESDEALSARIIKIANSVFFERGKQSRTIEESVLTIGTEELRTLLSASTLSEIFPSKHPLRTQLWGNDIATGIIARAIAERLRPEKVELAFLGGLMHDIGKLLLLQRAPDLYLKVLKLVENEGKTFLEAEAETFVFDHTEAGLLIAERWTFGSELSEIIRNHHRPFVESDYHATHPLPLSVIVKCADIIAHSLGLGHSTGMNRLRKTNEELLPEVWNIVRVAPNKVKDSLAEFKKKFDDEYELYNSAGQ